MYSAISTSVFVSKEEITRAARSSVIHPLQFFPLTQVAIRRVVCRTGASVSDRVEAIPRVSSAGKLSVPSQAASISCAMAASSLKSSDRSRAVSLKALRESLPSFKLDNASLTHWLRYLMLYFVSEGNFLSEI